MEKKFFDANLITIDGHMDEPVWNQVEEHTDFCELAVRGGAIAPEKTSFKIIPCADRLYVGVKCMEPKMAYVLDVMNKWDTWSSNSVELFFSPTGNPNAFYQFFFSVNGNTMQNYFEENGNVQPDRYMPEFKSAVYYGEDFWSLEVEIPMTAFYMTPYASFVDTWLVNVARCRRVFRDSEPSREEVLHLTWSRLNSKFLETNLFNSLSGFPGVSKEDDVHIVSASVEMTEQTADGYRGTMTIKTFGAVDGTYEFSSDHADTRTVTLSEGRDAFTVSCHYPECVRFKTQLSLKRLSDGKVFTRYYPVRVMYEPIQVFFTLPEYRGNFYPGQDYSKIAGRVKAYKPVTLKLEGPGIETQTLVPDADGNFTFETPNFEYGEAFLTVTGEGQELKKKIRRLAPTGKTMSWISGGNLIVNGKPYLRRNMYSPGYLTGEYNNRLYKTENIHETDASKSFVAIMPDRIDPNVAYAGGDLSLDGKPSEKMLEAFDRIIEINKDRDFTHYYLCDEPDLRDFSPIYLKHAYDYISEKDPYHVIWISIKVAEEFIECADWFETDPYLVILTDKNGKRVYENPISYVGRYVDNVVDMNRADKCMGFVATCFAYKDFNPKAEYPTFDELNTHVWEGMIHGGKTLCSFVCFDLYDRSDLHEGMSYVFESLEALDQLVMLGKRTELIKNDKVHAVLYDKGDEQMFVLVNMTQELQTVTLEGLTGQWHHFRNGGMITGNTFELKPLETVIGTSEVKDAGLATYAETVALIEKNEYERTHGGNLLFNRQEDIEVTASASFYRSGSVGPYKLFDGIKTNYSWSALAHTGFMELNLTKVKPTFSKVVVCGYYLDGMNVFTINNGEKVPLDYIDKLEEEFSTTYILKNSVKPDALRLEFNSANGRTELYEIEVF